jgi:hypothetical protein
MKNIILLGAWMLLLLPFGKSQTEAGTLMFGSHNSVTIGKYGFSFYVFPRAGIFVADNFAVGTVFRTRTTFVSYQERREWYFQYEAGIFSRYYFAPGKRLRPFAELEMRLDPEIREVNTSAGAGVSYFVTPGFSIEAQLLLGVDDLFDRPSLSLNSGWNIGFVFHLPLKKTE